ncbi:RluA family pseudouridine synthase [Pelagibacteraceae bacterium]|jgi:23S rRNA pseudouridine1911/1915/1917 synthase|nr:RluA family pseudouridine synthase [Pelagibacteraceae bacterium]|tara:strand:+ start:973 stop:1941 length:969 start_codon:yes stop_codon:yes gene_type:complete
MKFLVSEKDNGSRLDIFLSKKIDHLTRSNIKKTIDSNQVKINKIITNSSSKKIKSSDVIEIKLFIKSLDKLLPNKIKLDIHFEDKDILIVNKPKGMVVHPGAGNYQNTLANALIYKYKDNLSNTSGELRPGIVHRIDKETSGLLVVAKNNLSHSKLGKQFSDHSIKRKYLCLVWGIVRPLKGRIETLISRNKKNRQLMMVSDFNGKKAITNYKTIQVFNGNNIPKISLIECKLETGRTHQIRVHMKYKGSSLLGDQQYGKKNIKFKKINGDFFRVLSALKGQALHAKSLEFIHPSKNKWVSFESKLPDDFMKLLHLLRKHSG